LKRAVAPKSCHPWFQHYASVVRVRESVGELDAVVHDLVDGQGSRRQQRVERLPLDELHRNVGLAVRLADFMNGADIRMVESGSGSRFTRQPCVRGGIVEAAAKENFDCDVAVEPFVVGAIDLAHSAGAELAGDPVVSNPPVLKVRPAVHKHRTSGE
jgi:hypothetical protein